MKWSALLKSWCLLLDVIPGKQNIGANIRQSILKEFEPALREDAIIIGRIYCSGPVALNYRCGFESSWWAF